MTWPDLDFTKPDEPSPSTDLEYSLHNGQAHMLRYAALGEIIR